MKHFCRFLNGYASNNWLQSGVVVRTSLPSYMASYISFYSHFEISTFIVRRFIRLGLKSIILFDAFPGSTSLILV